MRTYSHIALILLTLVACSSRRVVRNGTPNGTEVLSTVAQETGACLSQNGGAKLVRVMPTTATVPVNSQVVWQVNVPAACVGTVQLIRDGVANETFITSTVFTKTYATAGTVTEKVSVAGTGTSLPLEATVVVAAASVSTDPAAPTQVACTRFDFAPAQVVIDVTADGIILSDAALQIGLTTNIPAQVVSASIYPANASLLIQGASVNANSTQVTLATRIAASGNVVLTFQVSDLAAPANTNYCSQLIPVVRRSIAYAAATLNFKVNGEEGTPVTGAPNMVSRANIDDAVTLSWTTTNAASCKIEGTSYTGVNGSVQIPGATAGAEATFTLACKDGNGTETKKAITARAMIRNGLVFHVDATYPDGVNGQRLCTSRSWKDLSTNATTGSLNGAEDCESVSGWNGTGAPNDPYRLELDSRNRNGGADYVQVPDSSALRPSEVTVCTWIKARSELSGTKLGDAPANNQFVIFKKNRRTGGFEGYAITRQGNNYTFQVTDKDGIHQGGAATTNADPTKFSYVCGSFDRPTVRSFLNGKAIASDSHNYDIDLTTRPLFIGRTGESNWDAFFDGSIAQVQIYNRALSADEILSNCKAHAHRFAGVTCAP